MSTSSRVDKGKGIAENQDDAPPPRSKRGGRSARQTRLDTAEEISRAYAEQLQEQEDREFAEEVHRQEEEMFRQSQEHSNEEEVQAPIKPAGRALVSDIFTKHFKKMPRAPAPNDKPEDPPKYNAYCNYCNNVYKWTHGGGYGTLRRHMETCHPGEYGIASTQTQIRGGTAFSATGTPSHPLFKYDHQHAENVMARYCAMEHQPFKFADKITYSESIKDAYCPAAKKISRTNMLRRIRRQTFDKKIELMKCLMNLDHKVSICADIWTDCFHKNNYMGITCHWVDDKWILQKRLIAFREFDDPHTATNIALIIITVLNEYQLINKVFSVGFDNASANTASIPELIEACNPSFQGKYFHSRCICHILNLCVQDALEIFNESVMPIRKAVNLLHKNITLGKKWQKYCRLKNIQHRGFVRDVSHRWNSTYEMLNSTLEYKDYLCEFFRKEFAAVQLTLLPSYWDQCMDLYQLLKVFNNATVQLSGVYYCTSVRVLEHCMYIALSFKNCFAKPNLQGVIYFMVQKWLKYFRNIPDVFLVAKCLDPKWKYDGVCQMLDIYYNAFMQMDFLNVRIDGEIIFFDIPNVTQIKDDLERTLRSLFAEYRMTHGIDLDMNAPSSTSSTTSSFIPLDLNSLDPLVQQLSSMYQDRSYELPRGQGNSELDMYLGCRFVFGVEDSAPQIDVMKWWSKRTEYPVLSIMAKELFAVPASTVSVEQAFSIGGLMLDQRRSTMKPRNIEATMLLDDWSKADLRAQENDWDDRDESGNEEFTESDRSVDEN